MSILKRVPVSLSWEPEGGEELLDVTEGDGIHDILDRCVERGEGEGHGFPQQRLTLRRIGSIGFESGE